MRVGEIRKYAASVATLLYRHLDSDPMVVASWPPVAKDLGCKVYYSCVAGSGPGHYVRPSELNDCGLIFINRAYTEYHQCHTFAHEIAHHILAHEVASSLFDERPRVEQYRDEDTDCHHLIAKEVQRLIFGVKDPWKMRI